MTSAAKCFFWFSITLLAAALSCKAREISPPPSEYGGPKRGATTTDNPELPASNPGTLPASTTNPESANKDGFYYQNLGGDLNGLTPATNNPANPTTPASAPRVDCKSAKQAYAFYYAWFAAPEYGGWKGVEVCHGDRPAYGLYDSANEAKITYDMNIAKEIGLNGFVIAWIGNHPSDLGKNKPNNVLKIMLRKAKEMGFCIAALFEAEMIYTQYDMNVATEMSTLINTLNAYPDNTFRINNKPVVFIWKNELVPAATWKSITNSNSVYLVGDAGPKAQGVTAAKNSETANAYYYSTWWSASLTSMGSMWTALGSRPKFGTVSPGFRPPNGTCPADSACYGRWKNTGDQVYRQQWDYLINKRPDYALITSYNEWPEGHYIEKSVNYGDSYLKLSRQFIAQYRQ